MTYENVVPYKGYDSNQCRATTRYTSGVVGYTTVPGNANDMRRALSHNGGHNGGGHA